MGRRKKEAVAATSDQKENFAKKFAVSSKDTFMLSDESMSAITDWIDTGSYSLNKILSGSIYKGIPNARVTALGGGYGTGKSLICGKIMKCAIAAGYDILLYDTEGDIDFNFYKRIGVDLEHVLVIPVAPGNEVQSIETFRNHVMNKIGEFKKANPKCKLMIVLDSFGNLPNEKELSDTEAGKTNSDMGQKQKAAKGMFRLISTFLSKHKIPMVFTNHVYKDTASAANPQYARNVMTGGEGAKYMASLMIMLSTSQIKDDKANTKLKTGVKIKAVAEKNRFVPPFLTGEIYLRFKTGVNRYYGLLEEAIAVDEIVKKSAGMYYIKHMDKTIRGETNLYNKEVFTKEVLDKIDEHCRNEYSFADHLETDEEIMEEIDRELNDGGDSTDGE